jgi:flagellar biosynthesis anti-sigma factor FlgM
MDVRDRSNYASSLETLSPKGAGLEGTAKLRADAVVPFDAAPPAAGKDSSQLSAAAQAVTQTMQMPEVRQERVTSLQQQIASGNYNVDTQAVADAMLRNLAG